MWHVAPLFQPARSFSLFLYLVQPDTLPNTFVDIQLCAQAGANVQTPSSIFNSVPRQGPSRVASSSSNLRRSVLLALLLLSFYTWKAEAQEVTLWPEAEPCLDSYYILLPLFSKYIHYRWPVLQRKRRGLGVKNKKGKTYFSSGGQ